MTDLRPCPACRRHVRVDEHACPFCTAELPAAAARVLPTGRLARAAVFVAGAALAATAGCGGAKARPDAHKTVENAPGDGGPVMGAPPDAAPPDAAPEHYLPAPYGAPPARQRLV